MVRWVRSDPEAIYPHESVCEDTLERPLTIILITQRSCDELCNLSSSYFLKDSVDGLAGHSHLMGAQRGNAG